MSSIAVNAITDASGGTTASINGYTPSASNMAGKNKIINGDMRIDQRNAGASVTPNNNYTLDRWIFENTQTSKVTIQQNAGAVTPPAGFTNYLGVTSSSAYSVLSGDTFLLGQRIEGYNVADFAWGTANAQTITVSFWVRSSLTGTFGGALQNVNATRSYPFSYVISAANTWEYKTVTIAGDTSGTWNTGNGRGAYLMLGLGSGATYSGTAGAWVTGNLVQPTSTISVVGTSGATFYITGVQLEVGSSASEFEHRQYGTELALCQRYYFRMVDGNTQAIATGGYYTATDVRMVVNFPVAMRTGPSVVSASGTDYFRIQRNGGDDAFNSILDGGPKTPTTIMVYQSSNVSGTAGHAGFVYSNNASASLAFNAEL